MDQAPTATPSELEFLVRHGSICALVGYGGVTIALWYREADARAVAAMEEVLPAYIERFPKGFSSIHVVVPSAGLPDSGARAALVDSARRWADRVAAVAVVVEREGFGGSALRSAVTGIHMLSRVEFPIRVMQTLREAAQWLPEPHREKTGIDLDSAKLLGALEQVRTL